MDHHGSTLVEARLKHIETILLDPAIGHSDIVVSMQWLGWWPTKTWVDHSMYVRIYIYIYIRMIISNIWENKNCSKPPTRYVYICIWCRTTCVCIYIYIHMYMCVYIYMMSKHICTGMKLGHCSWLMNSSYRTFLFGVLLFQDCSRIVSWEHLLHLPSDS